MSYDHAETYLGIKICDMLIIKVVYFDRHDNTLYALLNVYNGCEGWCYINKYRGWSINI